MQKGNIFLTLLIFCIIIGGIYGTYLLSIRSLPGDFLYTLKSELETLKLSTTELSKVQRALIYIEFANERLDEAEALQKKGETPFKILPSIEKFWENEQLALSVMTKETARVENTTPVYEGLKALRERQAKVLDHLLNIVPAPEFYVILDIKTKSEDALNEYNLR